MQHFNREDRPPQGPKPLKLVRVLKGPAQTYTILSTCLSGVWTHWDGQRSLPCYKARAKCTGCTRALPKRWKGYLCCWVVPQRAKFILEITPRAANQLLAAMPEGRIMRGFLIRVERTKGGRNGRLIVNLVGEDPNISALPAADDPFQTLNFLWGETGLDDHGQAALA